MVPVAHHLAELNGRVGEHVVQAFVRPAAFAVIGYAIIFESGIGSAGQVHKKRRSAELGTGHQ